MMKHLTLLLLTALVSCAAHAYELADQWSSVRAEGMGGAYSAVVTDSDALFYNPAQLASQTKFAWEVLDPRAGVNGVDNIMTLMDVVNGGTDSLSTSLQQLYGKRVWLGGGAKSTIMIPGFAIAAFSDFNAGIYVSNPANTTMNLNYFFDYGFAAGGGFELIPGFMKLGLVARRFNRTGTTLPIGAATLATLDTDKLQAELKRRGTGYAADLGTTFTIPGPVSPSLSFVYRNAGVTTFTHEEGAGAPPSIDPEMVIGAAMKFSGGLVDITPAIDFRYANRPDIDVGKKLHMGVEMALPLIDIRAGLNQGYYTAGVGLDLALLHIDVATYGVELGAYPGQQEDRRYVAQLRFELGFEPSTFGFGSSGASGSGNGEGGTRHRLKQRR